MKASHLMVMTTIVIVPCAADADCLQQSADFAQRICGEIKTIGRSALVTADGDLTAEAKGLIAEAVGQINDTVKGKIETKTFENVLQEQLAGEPVDLRQCGTEMADAAYQGCTKTAVWKTCANQAFGLAGWANEETLNGTSGWRRGGYNQGAYCTEFINSVIQTRGLDDLPHFVDDVKSSEENRRTGWMNTVSEYTYHCSIRLHWNPIYNQKKDPICGQE